GSRTAPARRAPRGAPPARCSSRRSRKHRAPPRPTPGRRDSEAPLARRGRARAARDPRANRSGVLRDVAQGERVSQRSQLLQALVLDLPDPLARDVEGLADLVQRSRVLAVQAVTQLEHTALAGAERGEHALQGRLAHLDLGNLLRQRLVLVGEEVPELRLLLVADRLLERHRRLRAAADLLHLVRRQLDVDRNLDRGRLAAELGAELALRADDLVQLLDDVD